jgi:hypothetical protein
MELPKLLLGGFFMGKREEGLELLDDNVKTSQSLVVFINVEGGEGKV